MATKAPKQKAQYAPTIVPIAIDDVDLPTEWMDFVRREGFAAAFGRDSEPEHVYNAVAAADVLFLFHSGGFQQYARRLLTALANLRGVKNPAVVIAQVTPNTRPGGAVDTANAPGIRVQLGDVTETFVSIAHSLNSGEMTPLRDFAPQLREAIFGTSRKSNERPGTRNVEQENPTSTAQSGTAGLRGSTSTRQSRTGGLGGSESAAINEGGTGGLGDSVVDHEQGEGDDEATTTEYRFDEIRQQEFSELAWQILEVTRRLGEGRPRPQASARRLLSAIVLSGLRTKGDERSGSWFVSLIPLERGDIRALIVGRYAAAARYKGFEAILRSGLKQSENMTELLHTILETARRLAAEARPGLPVLIGARHLLGAALRQNDSDSTIHKMLRDYRLQVDDVRQQLIAQLPAWGVDDDQDAWRSVLEPVTVSIEPHLPTYAADSAVGPDLIGITREVEAMSSLVSAWSVEPPLSIGLFGEWGSGKSFFMQKMKERVKQIAVEARKSNRAQRDFGYYKNIVQVEFNAWHYVEGNLWASLVEHIFTNLRFEGTDAEDLDSEDNVKKRLEKMLGLLRDKTAEADAKASAATTRHEEANQAEQDAADAAQRAQEAKATADAADRDSAEARQAAITEQAKAQDASEIRRGILLKDVVEDIHLSTEVRAEVESGLAKLGIGSERLQTIQGVREALKEATETGTVLAHGLALVRESGGWLLLLWAVAVPAIVILAGFAFDFLATQLSEGWLARVGTTVSTVFTLAASALASWKRIHPRVKPLVETVNKMKARRVEVEAKVEAERQKRAEKAAEAERAVIDAQAEAAKQRKISADKAAEALAARQDAENKRAEADRAAKDAAEARALALATALEADALRPERRIATFIQDRAAATDYRRHLGVPALVRRDFEKLSAMFQTQRDAEESGQDCGEGNQRNDPTIVNRIILYIDDLDRCPPKKVVEVLRAIHLLLAFRLFVVVVAVDARWMKRSLKDQFTLMLSTESRASEASRKDREADMPAENIAWRATASPDDYLEKIFQVPFWIRPLGRSGSRRLVTELTRHDVETDEQASGAPNAQDSSNPSDANMPDKSVASQANVPSGDVGKVSMSVQQDANASAVSQQTAPAGAASRPAGDEWSPVEPKPRTLMLTPEERDYMVSLAPVIGRSPRSVKRFVNCYRLLKSTLDPAELDRAKRSGTFRTSMLLLGIVTGFPEAAPALLTDLRDSGRDLAPEAWARAAAKRLQLEERGKWAELLPVIGRLRQWEVKTIGPLADAAILVDRFSFSPVQRPIEELV